MVPSSQSLHKAKSAQDIDLMMSLCADDAALANRAICERGAAYVAGSGARARSRSLVRAASPHPH